MKTNLLMCLAAFLSSSLLFAAPAETPSKPAAPSGGKDLTSKVENLGIPTEERFKGGQLYARNPWAMIDYKGRIYVGSGNSSNLGPAINAGPVPILSLDPKTKKFTKEWDVPDEQIDLFKVLSDGLLYIPGHDPKEGWELGNFYRKQKDGKWEKVRTFPNGIHMYDLVELNGKYYFAGSALGVSDDRGANITPILPKLSRIYAFLPFRNNIFLTHGHVTMGSTSSSAMLWRYDPETKKAVQAFQPKENLLPDTPENGVYKLARVTPFTEEHDRLLFLAGPSWNDHQMKPKAVFTATNPEGTTVASERIQLPDGAIPWDLKMYNGKAYLLFALPGDKGKTVNHLWSSGDGIVFTPLFQFSATTFARSFAYLNGFFYFGLGSELEDLKKVEIHPDTGRIVRVPFKLPAMRPAKGKSTTMKKG